MDARVKQELVAPWSAAERGSRNGDVATEPLPVIELSDSDSNDRVGGGCAYGIPPSASGSSGYGPHAPAIGRDSRRELAELVQAILESW
jgi:hypothetical protein